MRPVAALTLAFLAAPFLAATAVAAQADGGGAAAASSSAAATLAGMIGTSNASVRAATGRNRRTCMVWCVSLRFVPETPYTVTRS